MRRLLYFLTALVVFGIPLSVSAQKPAEHQLIRRTAVFPLKTNTEFKEAAEEAWWQIREEMTRSRRFLVASRQFLIKNDAYQPRSDLSPADTIILGRLLDAHALITGELTGRNLRMTVYDAGNGWVLWTQEVGLHPSLAIKDQLPGVARRLIRDFLASVPYQAHQVVDPLIGKPVYEEGDIRVAQADLGHENGVEIGDQIQWVQITSRNAGALFQEGGQISVVAEGRILRIDQNLALVEILRAKDLSSLQEFSLIRIPREAERLRAQHSLNESVQPVLNPELAMGEISEAEKLSRETRPLATTLSILGSIAAFLLLAF